MQTGVLSSENLAQVLRGIAQKRKQGFLEVNNGDQILQILFVAGKIVDAYDSFASAHQGVISKIGAAGVLPDNFSFSGQTYQALYQRLEEEDCVLDLDEFKVVVKQRVLGELYNLNLHAGAYYSFKVQMVEHEPEYAPTISVGQLLLDLVSLKDDEARFKEQFPVDHRIRVAGDPEGISIEEGFLLHALQSHVYPAEIEAASMLSSFHFREGLQNLYARGLVTIHTPMDDDEDDAGSRSLDDIVAALEESIDTEIEEIDLDDLTIDAYIESAESPAATVIGSVAPRQKVRTDSEEIDVLTVSWFGIWNAKLLQAEWVPGVLVLLFLLCALFAPFFTWDACLKAFSNF